MSQTSNRIREISEWIDLYNGHRDREAMTWGRLAKISEECGEVIEAYIGFTGQNPRKGVTHSIDQVGKEILDVALTALAAYSHLFPYEDPMERFIEHTLFLHKRMSNAVGHV